MREHNLDNVHEDMALRERQKNAGRQRPGHWAFTTVFICLIIHSGVLNCSVYTQISIRTDSVDVFVS